MTFELEIRWLRNVIPIFCLKLNILRSNALQWIRKRDKVVVTHPDISQIVKALTTQNKTLKIGDMLKWQL